jgi:hypothetical protein
MWYSVRDEVKGWPVLLKQQAAFCDRPFCDRPFVRRARNSCAPRQSERKVEPRIQESYSIFDDDRIEPRSAAVYAIASGDRVNAPSSSASIIVTLASA